MAREALSAEAPSANKGGLAAQSNQLLDGSVVKNPKKKPGNLLKSGIEHLKKSLLTGEMRKLKKMVMIIFSTQT